MDVGFVLMIMVASAIGVALLLLSFKPGGK